MQLEAAPVLSPQIDLLNEEKTKQNKPSGNQGPGLSYLLSQQLVEGNPVLGKSLLNE